MTTQRQIAEIIGNLTALAASMDHAARNPSTACNEETGEELEACCFAPDTLRNTASNLREYANVLIGLIPGDEIDMGGICSG